MGLEDMSAKQVMELLELAKALGNDRKAQSGTSQDDEGLQRRTSALRASYAEFSATRDYEVGDIVMWKNNMRNRRRPDYDDPAIVVEILEEPIYDDEKEVGSAYYREPLNVRLGLLDDEGDFVIYLYDGRRFKKMTS